MEMLIMTIAVLSFILKTASPEGPDIFSLKDPQSSAYNLTIHLTHLTSRSLGLSWTCNQHLHDKYEVTLKPLKATYRVIETVPHNSCTLTIENLIPDTDYQVSVTLFSGKFRQRSNAITIKTPIEDAEIEIDEVMEESSRELKLPRVRLVELSLVALALALWGGAIILFFHRWGKIRMLLPYQPDFKELKPTSSTCTNCSMTPHHQPSRLQQIQIQPELHGGFNTGIGMVAVTDTGCSPLRPRLNSFIGYNQSDIPMFSDFGNFRRARSAEQLVRNSQLEFDFTDF